MISKKLTILFRGASFMIDTMICTGIAIGICAICTLNNIFIIAFGLLLLIFRDVPGKSIGKLLLGLDIVDGQSNKRASLLQRLVKNITSFVTILEIPILLLRNDHKRIGDMLAKTETKINENSSALALFEYLTKLK